jgi:hydroxymethylpyrimidine/phosphomethylpyrimidine kinase
MILRRSSVLVFAGLDPSGGAGIQADIEAISAMGAHALPIVTTLTVQDNDRVFAVQAVDANIVRHADYPESAGSGRAV